MKAEPSTLAAQGTRYISKQVTGNKLKKPKLHFSGMYLVMREQQDHLAAEIWPLIPHCFNVGVDIFAIPGDVLWFPKLCPSEKRLSKPCLCRALCEVCVGRRAGMAGIKWNARAELMQGLSRVEYQGAKVTPSPPPRSSPLMAWKNGSNIYTADVSHQPSITHQELLPLKKPVKTLSTAFSSWLINCCLLITGGLQQWTIFGGNQDCALSNSLHSPCCI